MSALQLDVDRFRIQLLEWYDRNQRPLPWRKTRSPYRIWVSEIMLQQTRVAVVIERYRDFLKKFPSLKSLAESREADVLTAWSGLGYYRRARSLRQAARLVLKKHNGRVPWDLEELKMLPGVGEYTAAAISSIAYGKPHAVVDGNVKRVLTRLCGGPLADGLYWNRAQELLSPTRPGDFNQAMMELGATVCTPNPDCKSCPVYGECASQSQTAPFAPKQKVTRVKQRFGLSCKKNSVYLVQRPKSASIMPSMWELPAGDGSSAEKAYSLNHSITNTLYSVEVFRVAKPPDSPRGRWVAYDRLEKSPLTGLTRKILQRIGRL